MNKYVIYGKVKSGMDIGERIRQLRKSRGLTLKELSKKVDISVSFLSDIENDRSQPSLERVRALASGLDTTVSYLLGEGANLASQAGALSQAESKIVGVLRNPQLRVLVELLSDIEDWSNQDREELLAYLRAKRTARKKR